MGWRETYHATAPEYAFLDGQRFTVVQVTNRPNTVWSEQDIPVYRISFPERPGTAIDAFLEEVIDGHFTVGFTGTRDGMSGRQHDEVQRLVVRINPTRAVHGQCTGADSNFEGVLARNLRGVTIYSRPGHDDRGRAAYRDQYSFAYPKLPEEPYLVRNKKIVADADVMIATPGTRKEQLRSGTWSTIRHAKDVGKPLYVVLPDGNIEQFNV